MSEQRQHEHNDTGNARRFLDRYGHRVRYVDGVGWLVRDDRGVSRLDPQGHAVRQLAKDAIERAYNIEINAATAGHRDKLQGCLTYALTNKGLRQAIYEAISEPNVRIKAVQLDQNPVLLQTPTGVVDLRKAEERPAEPDEYLSRVTRVSFRPGAKAPTYDKFILSSMGGDPELVAYFHRVIGYALTGHVREKANFVIKGPTNSGKTIWARVMTRMLGTYAESVDLRRLLVLSQNENIFQGECANLEGRRFVFGVEPTRGLKIDGSQWNKVGGMDILKYKLTYKDSVPFWPTHKFFFLSTRLPEVDGTGEALNRYHLIDFGETHPFEEDEHQVGEKTAQRDLEERLLLESEGIFARAVVGAQDYLTNGGLRPPAGLIQARQDLKRDLDTFKSFLSRYTVKDPAGWAPYRELRRLYEHHCRERGEPPETDYQFKDALKQAGFPAKKNKERGQYRDAPGRVGLRLKRLDVGDAGDVGDGVPTNSSCY